MNEKPDRDLEASQAIQRRQESQQKWGTQTMGAVIGGAMGLLLAFGLQLVGWGGDNVLRFVLWGGVVGAMVAGMESLERAGRRLTRRDVPWLNVVVAVVGMAIIFALVMGLAYALTQLLRPFLER